MGCDIHMHVEYRPDAFYVNKKPGWVSGDYYRLCYDGLIQPRYVCTDFCGDRNYWLFSVLADVRNDGTFVYIDRPRGLPNDISEVVRNEFEPWSWDAHSCSYLTLKELIDFYEEHIDDEEGEIVLPLITKIKERADELGLIYTFSWEGNGSDKAYSKSDNIRIVFWFDN